MSIYVRDYIVSGMLPRGDVGYIQGTIGIGAPPAAEDVFIADLWAQFRKDFPVARSPQGGWTEPYVIAGEGDDD
jgi:hypothetical protein